MSTHLHDLALLRRYHVHGDAHARDELVRRAMPLVRSCARRYADRGETLEDLIQVGCVGLVKAIERFDVESGVRFASFAVPNITGEIKRHFRDGCWAVHVPRAVKELDARVNQTAARIERETGRPATTAQLAEALGLTREEIQDARRAGKAFRTDSLDAETGEDRPLAGAFGDVDAGFEQAEARQTVRQALRGLSPRERRVLVMRYHGDLYQREISERLGVSQMQASRLLRSGLAKAQQHARSEGQLVTNAG